MEDEKTTRLQISYDRVARQYVERIFNELEHKPLDRALLDRLAKDVQGSGRVCDLGCGPGQVARYLHQKGTDVFGIDLSAGMLEEARRLNPGIEFRQGNMLSLDDADGSWAGIAAFYSIIHIPREHIVSALCELKRVLQPEGLFLLAFHIGDEDVHRDELWGEEVSLDFLFFRSDEMEANLKSAGFMVEEIIERDPYPDIEYPSRRAYIFARKPDVG